MKGIVRTVRRALIRYVGWVGRGLEGGGLALACVAVAVVQALAVATCVIVVGALVVQGTTAWLHWTARWGRSAVRRSLGVMVIGVPSRPHERTVAGRAQEIVTDAVMWRELAWAWMQIPVGLAHLVVGLIPGLGTAYAVASARWTARMLGYGMRQSPSAQPPISCAQGVGHGLIGMRERVEVLGGTIETGPTPQGGFAVRVTIPLPLLACSGEDENY